MRKLRIPYHPLNTVVRSGSTEDFDALVALVVIKSTYVSGTIQNYTPSKAKQILGLDIYKAERVIKRMVHNKWAHFEQPGKSSNDTKPRLVTHNITKNQSCFHVYVQKQDGLVVNIDWKEESLESNKRISFKSVKDNLLQLYVMERINQHQTSYDNAKSKLDKCQKIMTNAEFVNSKVAALYDPTGMVRLFIKLGKYNPNEECHLLKQSFRDDTKRSDEQKSMTHVTFETMRKMFFGGKISVAKLKRIVKDIADKGGMKIDKYYRYLIYTDADDCYTREVNPFTSYNYLPTGKKTNNAKRLRKAEMKWNGDLKKSDPAYSKMRISACYRQLLSNCYKVTSEAVLADIAAFGKCGAAA